MNCCFQKADLLIPKQPFWHKWSVIACDQHTSDIGYWDIVKQLVGSSPSSLSVILPEAELHLMNERRITSIHKSMIQYSQSSLFDLHSDAFIYVERTLQNGAIRQGVVGVIDLEFYNIPADEYTKVYATEETVVERVLPRIKIRQGASLEFSHTVVFCDDPQMDLIEPLSDHKEFYEKLYDFDLMLDGGHISGWKIPPKEAEVFHERIAAYEKDNIYLVGDGNHSLLTAKRIYESRKASDPNGKWEESPCRYAMVELENIHSSVMCFESIHRVITGVDTKKFIEAFRMRAGGDSEKITLICGSETISFSLPLEHGQLLVGAVQDFLDQWVGEQSGEIDYIHGENVVKELAQRPDCVGIILPDFHKETLFSYIRDGNITPRKTFSIGKASEKRYYLEGRKIL